MAVFTPNKEIVTTESIVAVDIGPAKPIPLGSHTFQLVVEDDSGNLSKPQRIIVRIFEEGAPNAVLTGPPNVLLGQAFKLSGQGSEDTGGGKIVRYHWTLDPQP